MGPLMATESVGHVQVGGFASFRCRGGKQLVPLLQAGWPLLKNAKRATATANGKAARRAIQDVLERKLEDAR